MRIADRRTLASLLCKSKDSGGADGLSLHTGTASRPGPPRAAALEFSFMPRASG